MGFKEDKHYHKVEECCGSCKHYIMPIDDEFCTLDDSPDGWIQRDGICDEFKKE